MIVKDAGPGVQKLLDLNLDSAISYPFRLGKVDPFFSESQFPYSKMKIDFRRTVRTLKQNHVCKGFATMRAYLAG